MLIRRAELAPGDAIADVRIAAGRISSVTNATRTPELESGEPSIDAGGAALLPGLQDHHLHLLALSAALASLRCGPPEVESAQALANALRRAAAARRPGEWIRGIAYHESVAGELDRSALDAWTPEHPVRVQHRSGALWILNSAALRELGEEALASAGSHCERDARGHPTGRFLRADDWLRRQLAPDPAAALDGLARAGSALAQVGVTGATDATPHNGPTEWALFARAQSTGRLRQKLVVMGNDTPGGAENPALRRGARKWILDEASLPDFDAFVAAIRGVHDRSRAVAVHCVTRTDLAFALAAFREAGARAGDRVEHAAVADDEALGALSELGLCVVTQPNFLFERGDRYAVDVAAREQPWLYRCAGFERAGVALGGGTDAPFGEADPWAAMRAAVERRSRGGHRFEHTERLAPERALALFTTPLDAPGGAPRRIAPGEPADLVLLDRPWREARRDLCAAHVRMTLCDGESQSGLPSD